MTATQEKGNRSCSPDPLDMTEDGPMDPCSEDRASQHHESRATVFNIQRLCADGEDSRRIGPCNDLDHRLARPMTGLPNARCCRPSRR